MLNSHRLHKNLRLWSITCLFLCCVSPLGFSQIPTDKIIAKVERQTGGRVIAVKANRQKEHLYNVRVIMPNGRVKNLLINGSAQKNNHSQGNYQRKAVHRAKQYKNRR